MKRALITGITGQDGSYLAELLLEKGYEVHGIIRRASTFNTARIDHLYRDLHEKDVRLILHYGDLTDTSNLNRLLEKIQPQEIYNLGAQSHVRVSFEVPEYTADVDAVGTIRLLDAIRETGIPARFYQASTSELYGDAAEIQRSINKVYPRSLHASEDNLKLIERQKNDAFSWDYIKEINSLEKKLYDAINKKDLPLMMEISSNLLYKAEQFKKDFPRSDLLPEDTILKLRYIKFMGRDIPQITQLVQENLIGISANKKMLKTEVWQDLYKAVMKENPSRNTSEGKNPVDSVSYDDAERFCTRLSWLMAAKVSLPTEAEFKDAVGSLRYVDINAVSWNNFNSDGMTHPVATKKPNDKGFYDLLGNVEEFVKRVPDAPDATLMGGSITSTPDSIVGMAQSTIDRRGRKRTFGFRITVEK